MSRYDLSLDVVRKLYQAAANLVSTCVPWNRLSGMALAPSLPRCLLSPGAPGRSQNTSVEGHLVEGYYCYPCASEASSAFSEGVTPKSCQGPPRSQGV